MVKEYGLRRRWVRRGGLEGQDRGDHRLPGRTSAGSWTGGKFGSRLVDTFQWWWLITRTSIM